MKKAEKFSKSGIDIFIGLPGGNTRNKVGHHFDEWKHQIAPTNQSRREPKTS
jgi:hypothetical protein